MGVVDENMGVVDENMGVIDENMVIVNESLEDTGRGILLKYTGVYLL